MRRWRNNWLKKEIGMHYARWRRNYEVKTILGKIADRLGVSESTLYYNVAKRREKKENARKRIGVSKLFTTKEKAQEQTTKTEKV